MMRHRRFDRDPAMNASRSYRRPKVSVAGSGPEQVLERNADSTFKKDSAVTNIDLAQGG